MIHFPFSIESLKSGSPEAVKWAKGLTQEYLDDLEYKCREYEEDWELHEYYYVIKRIRDDNYDFNDVHFHALAKAAFFDEDKTAKEEIIGHSSEGNGGYRCARKIAYALWCESCDGRMLAYALLTGITRAEAKEISGYDELTTLWEYMNGDAPKVHRDLIETLLYEDEQPTEWKKAPRICLLNLIKDGLNHPDIPNFLAKYKDTEWGKSVGIANIMRERERKSCLAAILTLIAVIVILTLLILFVHHWGWIRGLFWWILAMPFFALICLLGYGLSVVITESLRSRYRKALKYARKRKRRRRNPFKKLRRIFK